jgi:hypothetical protein
LIAALICIHTDEELPHIFGPTGIDLEAFARWLLISSIRISIQRIYGIDYYDVGALICNMLIRYTLNWQCLDLQFVEWD